MDTPNTRRWFQFTLRESMLLVALTATGIGWYLDHGRIQYVSRIVQLMDEKVDTNNFTPRRDPLGNGMGRLDPLREKIPYRGRSFELVIELQE